MNRCAPALTDLAARAHWHLELGYAEALSADDEDNYYDEDYHEPSTCWKCGGEGFQIVCMDDLCHGQGYCMHGDGHISCSACGGEGRL
jgi:hypothetical protein